MATIDIAFETRPASKVFSLSAHSGTVDNITPEDLPGGLDGGWQVTGFATGSLFDSNGNPFYTISNQTIATPGSEATVSVYNYTSNPTDVTVTVIFGRVTVSVE